MTARAAVALSPVPTGPGPMRSAGLLYLQQIHARLAERGDLTVLTTSAEGPTGPPTHGTVIRLGPVASGVPGPVWSALGRSENLIRRVHPVVAPFPLSAALLRDSRAQDALAQADVVDLEWTEYMSLLPLVRRLAPRARIIGTFHDVMTQLQERRRAGSSGVAGALLDETRLRLTRRRERALLRSLDTVVTLNDKDAQLLRSLGASQVEVIDPPVAPDLELERRRSEIPCIGIVASFARSVNVDGARWFLDLVWPQVRAAVPHARLQLIGNDPAGEAAALSAGHEGVSATGFVEDLDPYYSSLWVTAVPLRMGSGIKFKTLEAMSRGVPTVSTTIGAEGIHEADRLQAVTDDARTFAASVIDVLEDPSDAELSARLLAASVRSRFGIGTFRAAVDRVYSGE